MCNELKIVKFECGCIGSAPNAEGKAWVFVACDSENGGPGGRHRSFAGKRRYQPVGMEFAEVVWDAFSQAAHYRALKRALREVKSHIDNN